MQTFAQKSNAAVLTVPANAAPGARQQRGHGPHEARTGAVAGGARFVHDFSQIPLHTGPLPATERAKLAEAATMGETTLPDAGVPSGPDAGAPPPAAPVDAGAPARKAELKSGPTYTPSGTVKATKSGGTKTAGFKMAAEFKHDPAKGIDAAAGEIRQYIKWTAAEDPPRTGAFTPASAYPGDTWYEDRDPAGKRYGHRSGSYAECVSINHYETAAGVKDCANGAKFVGEDAPVAGAARTGKWSFELRAVDTVSGTDIGTPASVAIDWNV